MHAPLISRIKVLAGMNIAERHHSQDGRIAVSVDGESMTFRVSTSNTAWGETAVLHGLNQAAPIASLSELGLQPEALGEYSRLLHSLCGMVVAGGPPGSGRTALLHASIHQFDHEERKVITIEDSIEYRIDGITQLEVDYQKKMTMARLLGSSMRLDPDVVVVGDVRDRETAKAAVQAALTGHLILASVHANDAVDTLFRLIDLGIEPFLLTSALAGAISQRLVRRVCPDCQVLRAVPEEEALAYEREMGEKRESFAHGEGCDHCAHTGYRDRIGIYEVLVVSEVIRRMLLAGASADEIRAQAVREGMVSLRRDGMTKVREGVTTPHEVLRGVSALD
jgi:general secretion pathway protein E